MSDTPRTDAQEGYERHEDGPCVPATLARELELRNRQLEAALVKRQQRLDCVERELAAKDAELAEAKRQVWEGARLINANATALIECAECAKRLEADVTALREAAIELLRLKAIKDWLDMPVGDPYGVGLNIGRLKIDYRDNKPKAWEALRAALAEGK